jgi:glutathione S-transferase
MTLALYYHPLSSFCWKALIALYELELAFEPKLVDLGDPEAHAAFLQIAPLGQFPVLQDRAEIIPESSMIIEYLDRVFSPGSLVPADADRSWRVRAADRFYDLHVQVPMQKIVTDKLRPAGAGDGFGVEQARARLNAALALVDGDMGERQWAIGDDFTMADCAAAPALYYADKVAPLSVSRPQASAYLERLKQRPSFARVLSEAQPYFALFPG